MSVNEFEQFVTSVYRKWGIDLGQYKRAQMERRLTSFRDKKGYDTYHAFFRALQEDETLFYEFLDRMTINVSEFFRNESRWQVLEQKIVPALLQNNKRLKIWSAACSTGEEPYSLVLLLSRLLPLTHIQVFASDFDRNALAKARTGVYDARSVRTVPCDLLSTYFTKLNNRYVIADDIKARVTFRHHNLLSDPFESDYDLIVCRNVLIYFTDDAKQTLYTRFAKALRPGGVFFVGSTEHIFNADRFDLHSIEPFFYCKST